MTLPRTSSSHRGRLVTISRAIACILSRECSCFRPRVCITKLSVYIRPSLHNSSRFLSDSVPAASMPNLNSAASRPTKALSLEQKAPSAWRASKLHATRSNHTHTHTPFGTVCKIGGLLRTSYKSYESAKPHCHKASRGCVVCVCRTLLAANTDCLQWRALSKPVESVSTQSTTTTENTCNNDLLANDHKNVVAIA